MAWGGDVVRLAGAGGRGGGGVNEAAVLGGGGEDGFLGVGSMTTRIVRRGRHTNTLNGATEPKRQPEKQRKYQ